MKNIKMYLHGIDVKSNPNPIAFTKPPTDNSATSAAQTLTSSSRLALHRKIRFVLTLAHLAAADITYYAVHMYEQASIHNTYSETPCDRARPNYIVAHSPSLSLLCFRSFVLSTLCVRENPTKMVEFNNDGGHVSPYKNIAP